MGLQMGSNVIELKISKQTWWMSAGQAAYGLRSTTIYMTLSRYHIDLKLSAKKRVRKMLLKTKPLAASSTALYVSARFFSVSSPVNCLGKII